MTIVHVYVTSSSKKAPLWITSQPAQTEGQTASRPGISADLGIATPRRCGAVTPLKNKNLQHPPHQKQRDDDGYSMANPLTSGLRSAKLKHAAMVASAVAHIAKLSRSPKATICRCSNRNTMQLNYPNLIK